MYDLYRKCPFTFLQTRVTEHNAFYCLWSETVTVLL